MEQEEDAHTSTKRVEERRKKFNFTVIIQPFFSSFIPFNHLFKKQNWTGHLNQYIREACVCG